MVGDPDLNQTLVNHYLDIVTPIDGRPLGLLISPDAGRQSYPLLAAGMKQIEGQQYDTAVLLEGSPEQKISFQNEGQVVTPLGDMEIDSQTGDALKAKLPAVKALELTRGKRSELIEASFSSLLPFLKNIASDVKLLPLLIPADEYDLALTLGNTLSEILRGKQAVVIAQGALEKTLFTAFEFNNPDTLMQAVKHPDGKQNGAAPAAAVLQFAHQSGGNTVSVLEKHLRGSFSHSAVMLWDYQAPQLDHRQQTELFRLALKAIESFVIDGQIKEYQTDDPMLNRKAGVFVTLRIRGSLRGCIGHMSAEKPLAQSVQEMAVAAATSDPRFPPLNRTELKQISIKIAILSPMQRITPEQVEVGKHGLLISSRGQRGVLLPEVASERGWDRETFLEHVCLKAGLPRAAWRQNLGLYAFSSVVFGDG